MITPEYVALKTSMKNRGQERPIALDQNCVVVDGYHRLKACHELGLKPILEIKKFRDTEDRICYALEHNLARRHLKNDFVIVKASQPLLQYLKKQAAKRKSEAKAPIGTDGRKGKSTTIVAKQVGVSPRMFERLQYLLENASPEILTKVESRRLNAYKAEKMVRKEKNKMVSGSEPKQKIDELKVCDGCGGKSTREDLERAKPCKQCPETLQRARNIDHPQNPPKESPANEKIDPHPQNSLMASRSIEPQGSI